MGAVNKLMFSLYVMITLHLYRSLLRCGDMSGKYKGAFIRFIERDFEALRLRAPFVSVNSRPSSSFNC